MDHSLILEQNYVLNVIRPNVKNVFREMTNVLFVLEDNMSSQKVHALKRQIAIIQWAFSQLLMPIV